MAEQKYNRWLNDLNGLHGLSGLCIVSAFWHQSRPFNATKIATMAEVAIHLIYIDVRKYEPFLSLNDYLLFVGISHSFQVLSQISNVLRGVERSQRASDVWGLTGASGRRVKPFAFDTSVDAIADQLEAFNAREFGDSAPIPHSDPSVPQRIPDRRTAAASLCKKGKSSMFALFGPHSPNWNQITFE